VTVGRRDPTWLAKAVVAVANERNVTTTAASVAFYVFNAAIPAALLGFVLLASLGETGLVHQLFELVLGEHPTRLRRTIDRLSRESESRERTAGIAAAILAWSAFRMFQTVNSSFAEIYDERKDLPLTKVVLDTLFVLGAAVAGVLVVGVGGALLSFRAEETGWVPFTTLLLFVVLVVAFLPVYYYFPHIETSVRDAVPGTVLAAAGWTVSGVFFRVYLSVSADPYGLAGAVLLFLTWLYVGGLLLLLGGVVNAVVGDHVEVDFDWLPDVADLT
jgi:membrane protein